LKLSFLYLSLRERSASSEAVSRVRGYGLSRVLDPHTPTLSPIRAFTPVFDG
jgi:hypothetical protein